MNSIFFVLLLYNKTLVFVISHFCLPLGNRDYPIKVGSNVLSCVRQLYGRLSNAFL